MGVRRASRYLSMKQTRQSASTIAKFSGLCCALGAGGLLTGCQSSLFLPEDVELRTAVLETAKRDLNEARTRPGGKPLQREERVEALKLAPEILQQIQRETGAAAYADAP